MSADSPESDKGQTRECQQKPGPSTKDDVIGGEGDKIFLEKEYFLVLLLVLDRVTREG